MKKMFNMPVIDIREFEKENIVTGSNTGAYKAVRESGAAEGNITLIDEMLEF